MSTTLDFTNKSQLKSGASALLVGTHGLLEGYSKNISQDSPFQGLTEPVLAGKTKVNTKYGADAAHQVRLILSASAVEEPPKLTRDICPVRCFAS